MIFPTKESGPSRACMRRNGVCRFVAQSTTRVLIVDATQTVAARLVVVDALHERVARFYEALGFRRIPESLLLVQKVADIELSLRRAD
jgi:hypothetical protein